VCVCIGPTRSRWFRPETDQDRGLQPCRVVAVVAVNLQRWRADDLATGRKLGLQRRSLLGQVLVWPDVDVFQIPPSNSSGSSAAGVGTG
jgi:hypothetical protein